MRSVAVVLCTLSTLPLLAASAPAQMREGPSFDRGERAIVRAINRIRHHHGLPGLRRSGRLAAAADAHSAEMLAGGYFGHGAMAQRIAAYGHYRGVGETLAWSPAAGARTIVRMWMRSPPHRVVLLRRSYRRLGVGRRSGLLGTARIAMVTADFATRH